MIPKVLEMKGKLRKRSMKNRQNQIMDYIWKVSMSNRKD